MRKTKTKPRRFVYPSPARCPRCKQYDTKARRTDNERGVQYRICRRAHCRWKFSVTGERIEPPAAASETETFSCPHCDKTYKRQNGLTRHVNTKHADRKGEHDGEGKGAGPHRRETGGAEDCDAGHGDRDTGGETGSSGPEAS